MVAILLALCDFKSLVRSLSDFKSLSGCSFANWASKIKMVGPAFELVENCCRPFSHVWTTASPNYRFTVLQRTASGHKLVLFRIRARKTNKHIGRDGVPLNKQEPSWDKQDPSLGQTGPVPGINWSFSVEFHSKIAVLSRLSLGRVGVRPWNGCPARAVRKMFLSFVFFFSPFFTLRSWVAQRFLPAIAMEPQRCLPFTFMNHRQGPSTLELFPD